MNIWRKVILKWFLSFMQMTSRGKTTSDIFYIDIFLKNCWLDLFTKLSEVKNTTTKEMSLSPHT